MENQDKSSGEIITFYSYKGGVGRSMALANVACLLGQQQDSNGKVLMIDWDLEAPGLHQFFHGKILSDSKDLPPNQLGLIDFFYELRDHLQKNPSLEDKPEKLFLNLEKYFIRTNQPALYLLPAGNFSDGLYSSRVNKFDWASFFNNHPSIISEFARYLRKEFQYILIDSRTGYSDISGICTSIMPEKLVTVFTPNRQSLSGIVGMIHRAVEYRKQSDDLRPLKIYPLPSRTDDAESDLQEEWRSGNYRKGITGYQESLETVLKDVYSLPVCSLETYFNETKIQYVPKYAYGEEIAVISERSERLSLARSFENFLDVVKGDENHWEYGDDIEKTEDIYSRTDSSVSQAILRTGMTALGSAVVLGFIYWVILQNPQTLYDILNSQFLGLLLIVWFIVDIAWVERWRSLLGRTSTLISKPWIFSRDHEPNSHPLYPRLFLEQMALAPRRNTRTSEKNNFQDPLSQWTLAIRDLVFNPKKPLRTLGFLLSFVFFIFFLLADSIMIANTMLLMGLIAELSPILQRLDLAILGGALFAGVVGVWMFLEFSSESGELVSIDMLSSHQRRLQRVLSMLVALFSIIITMALAIQRLVSIGFVETTPTLDITLSFALFGLITINSFLAAALTFSPATSGFVVIIYIVFGVFRSVLPILAFLSDLMARVIYIMFDTIFWAVFTPIVAIPALIQKTSGSFYDAP